MQCSGGCAGIETKRRMLEWKAVRMQMAAETMGTQHRTATLFLIQLNCYGNEDPDGLQLYPMLMCLRELRTRLKIFFSLFSKLLVIQ